MTIPELKQHHLFARLSEQQKVYVVARCLGKSRDDAAREAYPQAKPDSILVIGGRLEKRSDIDWLIKEFNGGNPPSKEEVLKKAWQIANSTQEHKVQLDALRLIGTISGWGKEPDVSPADPPVPPKEDGEDDFDPS